MAEEQGWQHHGLDEEEGGGKGMGAGASRGVTRVGSRGGVGQGAR